MAQVDANATFRNLTNYGSQIGQNYGSVINNFISPVHAAATTIPPVPLSTVPFRRDVDFVERENLFNQIEQKCSQDAARVALVGIGGAGKSQLAIEYSYRLRERSPDTWVFWVYASNTERIEQGYREIAERVKIAGRNDHEENIFALVERWLRYEGKWLLILDNMDSDAVLSTPLMTKSKSSSDDRADKQSQTLSAYIPQSRNGVVMITSRRGDVATKLVEERDVIQIGPMADTDAIALLKKKLNMQELNGEMKELARSLEHMPLAIVQATAYIQQKGSKYSVRQYLEQFQRSDLEQTSLLNYRAGHLRRDIEAKNSIIITWQMSFDDIRGRWPSSANLLSLMSFFDRQGIPKEALKSPRVEAGQASQRPRIPRLIERVIRTTRPIRYVGASENSVGDTFDEDIDRLRNYAFVAVGTDGLTFEMHRLVQLAIRQWLELHGEDEKWRSLCCKKLSAIFPRSARKNWSECEKLFPHAKQVESQQPRDDGGILAWANVLQRAGEYAWTKGDYDSAESMFSKSAQALTKVYGNEHVDTAYCLNYLASAYRDQGRLKEAQELFEQVVKTRKMLLGEEHPDTLACIGNLAMTYQCQHRWEEAKKMVTQVMETSKRVHGEEHRNTIISMGNLATIYRDQGRFEEAEKLLVRMVEPSQRVFGKEDSNTTAIQVHLALVYQNQGRLQEAAELLVPAIEALTNVHGEDHADTLACMSTLARIYRIQRRWTEKEELEVRMMKARKRALGEEHPDTIANMANLATTYQSQGRLKEAEKLGLLVIQMEKRLLGAEHPETLDSIDRLATIYQMQGRLAEAEALKMEAMETRIAATLSAWQNTLHEG